MMAGTMRAAEHGVALLQPVANDADAAMVTGRCPCVDGALEAVECVGRAVHLDLKGPVVVVAAGFTDRHGRLACRSKFPTQRPARELCSACGKTPAITRAVHVRNNQGEVVGGSYRGEPNHDR